MIIKPIEFTGKNMNTGRKETKAIKFSFNALTQPEDELLIDDIPAEVHKRLKKDPQSLPEYFVFTPECIWKLTKAEFDRIKKEIDKTKRYERLKRDKDEYYNVRVDDEWEDMQLTKMFDDLNDFLNIY